MLMALKMGWFMVIKLQYSRRYSAASFHYEQIIENLACQYKIGYPFI